MEVSENERFTRDYFDPEKRGIGNAIQVFFKDGTHTRRVEVEYPIGHRRRREEGIPVLVRKFQNAIGDHYPASQAERIESLCASQDTLEKLAVNDFVAAFVHSHG
jgi:2-methylcitrate dehydratase